LGKTCNNYKSSIANYLQLLKQGSSVRRLPPKGNKSAVLSFTEHVTASRDFRTFVL